MRSLLIEGWDAHMLVDALAASLTFCLVMGIAAVAAIRFRSLGADE